MTIITPARLIEESHAVRGFPIKAVKTICDVHMLENHAEVKNYDSDNITEWLKPICDLSSFKNRYPLNGITEGLNYWLWQEKRSIEVRDGEYGWVQGNKTGEVIYWSYPFAGDGNFYDIPTHKPVILDLAYCGSTQVKKIEIPDNVEIVFFGLSKCFGLQNYRIGYMWSKKKIDYLDPLINWAKYYNYYAVSLGDALINNTSVDLVYNTLRPYQTEICNKLNLIASDTVWLATSSDSVYDSMKRGKTNRLCLTNFMKDLYYEKVVGKHR